MTDDDARSLLRKTHHYSRRKFLNPEDGEDYAQQAVLKYLEKPDHTQSIQYAVLDARRTILRKERSRFYKEWLDDHSVLSTQKYHSTALDAMICHEILDSLEPDERIALKLYYGYEFRLTEIAKILDTSESQLSLLLSSVVRKLRARNEL